MQVWGEVMQASGMSDQGSGSTSLLNLSDLPLRVGFIFSLASYTINEQLK